MKNRIEQRRLRHQRLRQKVIGTAARPRMAIAMSNKNIQVQFIDDDKGMTLASASTFKSDANLNIATAKEIGAKAAAAAIEKGISLVVVDRGGFGFHGRVKELVDAAVAAGLKISTKAPVAEEEAK